MPNLPSDHESALERRFQLMCWFEDHAKTVIYVFWLPDEMAVKEVRGRAITTVADTARIGDEVTVDWREDCTYTTSRREALERCVRRTHRGILAARAL